MLGRPEVGSVIVVLNHAVICLRRVCFPPLLFLLTGEPCSLGYCHEETAKFCDYGKCIKMQINLDLNLSATLCVCVCVRTNCVFITCFQYWVCIRLGLKSDTICLIYNLRNSPPKMIHGWTIPFFFLFPSQYVPYFVSNLIESVSYLNFFFPLT